MIEVNGTKYYTTVEIAKKIGVSKRLIQDWCRKGMIKPFKFSPGKFYYDEASIEKHIRQGE
jgi:DNA-binding transcriptional MerR regulator